VVLAGSMLESCQGLLDKGIHPTAISESFSHALTKSMEILKSISYPVDLADRE